DPAERRRDEPVDRQAGPGYRRVRDHLPAREHRRRGAQRRQRLPLPAPAARYWGLSQQDYYARADVWPLAPKGEILVVIQCEDVKAIENLPKILEQVKGIGVVLIGEGDLSQELGQPREYEHPVVAEAIDRILKICKDQHVPCGHPHPDAKNIERLIASGYRFL